MRIALTQSEGRLAGLETELLRRGHEVVRAPLIETRPCLTNEVRRAASVLSDLPWLLFTSSSGVEAWRALGMSFQGSSIGTVGQKTAEKVERFGGQVELIGEPQTALGLAKTFLERGEAGPVGLPQGNRALPTLARALTHKGVEVRPLVIYHTVQLAWQADRVDAVVLSSPSAVEALPDRVGTSARLLVLGPSTAVAVRERGWTCLQAERPDPAALITLLEKRAKEPR